MSFPGKSKALMLALFASAGSGVDLAGILEVNKCERENCTVVSKRRRGGIKIGHPCAMGDPIVVLRPLTWH